tara:strand:- start:454 stop:855 length:402 start_codon:yes stop_codon:yes gene_type:complete
MNEPKTGEDWGRLAVSLPGWRWLPGMRWVVLSPEAEGRLHDTTEAAWWNDPRTDVEGESVPDPDDPATEGCLARLLGPRVLIRVMPREARRVIEIVIPSGMTADFPTVVRDEMLGRATIAAAAAIGRWPGGEG